MLSAAQAACFHPERITAAPFRGSIRDLLFSRIGFEPPPAYGLSEWETAVPEDEPVILEVLEALRPEVVAHARQEAEALTAYARDAGMHQDRTLGLVDIGYSGTIQKSLQDVLSMPFVGFYMGVFDTAEGVEEREGYAFGCLAEGIRPWSSDCPALQYTLKMEALLTAPHGQLQSFAQEDGRPVPRLKPGTLSPAEAKQLAAMHRGVTMYCDELLDTYGPELLSAEIELMMPQEFLRMVVTQIIRIPDDLAPVLRVEDNFSGNEEITAVDGNLDFRKSGA